MTKCGWGGGGQIPPFLCDVIYGRPRRGHLDVPAERLKKLERLAANKWENPTLSQADHVSSGGIIIIIIGSFVFSCYLHCSEGKPRACARYRCCGAPRASQLTAAGPETI